MILGSEHAHESCWRYMLDKQLIDQEDALMLEIQVIEGMPRSKK